MTQFLESPLFAAAVLALALLEFYVRDRRGLGYDARALGGSIGVYVGQVLLNLPGFLVVGAIFVAAAKLTPLHWPADDWRTWACGFLAVELAYYWQHRMLHQMRWFWATHAVHHSTNELTLPAATRLGWAGWATGTFLPMVVPVLIGFPPLVVGTLLVLNLRYQFFLHTELVGRLGVLEWVLNTPAHHRVHHSALPEHRNCNFGGVLIIFDRLFGTLRTHADDTPLRYGRATPLESSNPLVIAMHEWRAIVTDLRAAPDPGTRLSILFRPSSLEAETAPARPAPMRQTA